LSAVIDDKHGEYMERVGVPLQVDVQSDLVTAMPRAVRCTYLQWENGTDVRPSMSKTTFYKHRNDLLAYGIDIAVPKAAAGSVIPLFKTVSGEEVKTPSDWYARNLIHIGNLKYAS
jgi:II/X family phage/plasmid replication protein